MIAPLGRLRVRPRHVSACVWRTGRRSEAVPTEAASTDLAVFTRKLKGNGLAAMRRMRLALTASSCALPGVPHQLCQFHFLREAALPVFEADRHAKVLLKKPIRGVRPIERAMEGRDDAEAEVARGYCAAVRSALTDDGRAPLAASGLTLKERLEKVVASRSTRRRCSSVEHKALTGPGLRARGLRAQSTEARAACSVPNRMARLGRPMSQRTA